MMSSILTLIHSTRRIAECVKHSRADLVQRPSAEMAAEVIVTAMGVRSLREGESQERLPVPASVHFHC
jgi:hypothetical protein